MSKPTIKIEYPSAGATYCNYAYGVYAYDEWPMSSVLGGQSRRTYIREYPTLEEAQAAHPDAITTESCGYIASTGTELPRVAPSWFDPMDAGEQWDEDY
jgi:hypothetical protein